MKCPNCGEEMEEGFIYGRRDSGLLWLPSKENLSLTLTESGIKKRNGLRLGKRPFPEMTKLDFCVCRKCGVGVSKF
ncbi:PF20097 family protein [Anaerotignum sp.]|uniref:PF20097 family protein n=1 Tax=Anaerotignum sp. TaxID=2039241 RepID=UPI0028969D3C|nr:PF20097 family protein [Anaerotignum sp.]